VAGSLLKLWGWLAVVLGGLLVLAGGAAILIAVDLAAKPGANGSDDVNGLFVGGIVAACLGAVLLLVGTGLAIWGNARAQRSLEDALLRSAALEQAQQ